MSDTPSDRFQNSDALPALTPYPLPSALRAEIFIIALTALTGLLGGMVITLVYLGLGTLEQAFLLGGLIALGALLTLLVLLRARALEQNAIAKWTNQITAERREQARLFKHQRAQIESLETELALYTQTDAANIIPDIRGWEALGMSEAELAPQMQILATLFRGQARILIQKKFNGGHRNRGIYQIRASGEADRIVKIARSSDIRAERQAQKWIDRFSQNNGTRYVRDLHGAEDNALGGMVYQLAALRRNANIVSLEMFYRATQRPATCAQIIQQLYSETLPHSEFRHAQTIALWREFALPERVLERVENALGEIPDLAHITRAEATARIVFGGHTQLVRNPLYWARVEMAPYRDRQAAVMCGVIHGDLHSGNVLAEFPLQALWLIDFAKTRADAPTLLDFARLEADLKFFLLTDEAADYARVMQWEEQWLAPRSTTTLAPSDEAFRELDAEMQKASVCIAALRRVAVNHRADAQSEGNGHFADDSVLPYYFALWHTTMRTLYYAQCTAKQKIYAFFSAALLAERIMQLLNDRV